MENSSTWNTRTVDVIIPTLKRPHAFSSLSLLRYIPWSIRLILVTEGKSWAEAVNIGISEVKNNDVILMDDDVFLRENTFSHIDEQYDKADIFGFKLLYPDGRIQHAGGVADEERIGHIGNGHNDEGQFDKLYYCCHVTTSLCYIKNHVLKQLKGMATDYPGMQFEDVDFNFRALKNGFKLLYTPGPAVHWESASKKFIPRFSEHISASREELIKRHWADKEFVKVITSYPVLLGDKCLVA